MFWAIGKAKRTFSHGIHPPEHKDATKDKPIRRLPFPPEMIIPLSQHAGAPAVPIVREGQEVVRGEPIARPGGFVSVAMHAPATGVVRRIALAPSSAGHMVPAIHLKLHPGAGQEILYGAPVDPDALGAEETIQAIQEAGIVGLGGAAFPTHVKLAVPEGKHIDTIIANGCECEPYLTADYRTMLERPDHLFTGLRIVLRASGAKQAIIGIEDNKADAADLLASRVPPDLPVEIRLVEAKYPQGAEKMLIKALLDREVPSGGLPVDVHAAVFNVGTLAQIGELVPRHGGLIERIVTVTGPGVERPGNYLMPLGTPLAFVLEYTGVKPDVAEVILGGPMMGFAVGAWDIPVTKGVTGILVLTRDRMMPTTTKVYPCIRCGSCLRACPMHLNPSQLGMLASRRRYDEMAEKYHLMDCFECGCCSYVCPSNIPLVQSMRIAKGIVRQRKAANK